VPRAGQGAPRFEKQWFEPLIGSLRCFNYDFMIIDAAALTAFPTVIHLVATVDATLLAVRSGATAARALRRVAEEVPVGEEHRAGAVRRQDSAVERSRERARVTPFEDLSPGTSLA
jgi:hypothetical protein